MDLLRLRDEGGRAVFKLTGESAGSKPLIEALMPAEGMLQACAHCGVWESYMGHRFIACGACRERYYCSATCRGEDLRDELHGADCPLLQQGRELEVESRRNLHDNMWNFRNRKNRSTLLSSAPTRYPVAPGSDRNSTSPRFSYPFCECRASAA
ncbi:uncharacterized protein B0H18DRAFT_1059213 [Fomitopsis serialis]|uniref:uncharacterized protein n=1 Tax=Fomitopsis serialis TaxID=139415 RepID=UPI0020077581|nr:uncharacterized protein B0H18DRAFT_1059213 [Neoantrodia serialis]KAH9911792.1 hypothetical protein B0H18DRAFT_1059213 [Neoantrodia serialis]